MEALHDDAKPSTGEPLPLTLLWGTWEMWCDVPLRPQGHHADKANWLDQVKSIGLFDSAEGFWGIFNCTILPSQLPPNGSFYLFRKHIAPMWEHEANRRGGKWVIPFTIKAAKDEKKMQAVDVAWQTLCLSAIGELFPCEEEEICGVTVSRGKQRVSHPTHMASGASEWKLCLWTRSAGDEAAQRRIAEFVRKQLLQGVHGEDSTLGPVGHTDESRESSTEAESRTSASKAREAYDLPASITYVAHRELMEAKQGFLKSGNSAGQAFKPKYTVLLST